MSLGAEAGRGGSPRRPGRSGRAAVRVSAVVVMEVQARLADPMPVMVELTWCRTDPCAVRMVFQCGRTSAGDVEWFVGRELLVEGLDLDAGRGDVRIGPADTDPEAALRLVLSTGEENRAVFLLSRDELERFLADTQAVIPLGEESRHIAWDDELTALLAAGEAGGGW